MRRISLGLDTSGRPLVIDDRTQAKLRAAEAALGFTFTIVQGSFRAGDGAAASAGTHDDGGVIDLRTWNLPRTITPTDAVLALRRAGLIAWYRTKAQGFDPHIHAIDYGNPALSPAAARQVTAWRNGRNGLASNGPDDGPRVRIPIDPPEDDVTPDDIEKVADRVVAKLLATEIRNATPGGETKPAKFGNMVTNIEATGDKQNQRLAAIEAKLDALLAAKAKAAPGK